MPSSEPKPKARSISDKHGVQSPEQKGDRQRPRVDEPNAQEERSDEDHIDGADTEDQATHPTDSQAGKIDKEEVDEQDFQDPDFQRIGTQDSVESSGWSSSPLPIKDPSQRAPSPVYHPETKIPDIAPSAESQKSLQRSPILPSPTPRKSTPKKTFQIPMVAESHPPSTGSASRPYELHLDNEQWLKLQAYIENEIIDYKFECKGLLREAMFPIQKGHAFITQGRGDYDHGDRDFQQGNRKLAMLGNTVMRMIMMDVWMRQAKTVASLDKKITKFTCNAYLADRAQILKIDLLVKDYFPGGVVCGKKNVLATTVKAIVGAVWSDSKLKESADSERVIKDLIDRLLETKLGRGSKR